MRDGPEPERILVPTQLPVGTVNVYLLTGEENVLVDTGPHHPESRQELELGLRRAGLQLADIDIIIITHGHVDHYGQAGDLSRASGAEVWVPELERETIANFAETYEERKEFYSEHFLRTGVPEETLRLVADFFDYIKSLATESPVHRTFRDGERLSVGGLELEVIHTPGHSPGSSCFRSGSVLFTGDTVLKHITPNAAFGAADGRSVGMQDYLRSLERLRGLDVSRLYPGHGPPLEGLNEFIENYLALYRSRRAALLELLEGDGHTAFELVIRLLGSLPIHEIFLGVTEVLGHLEILQREGIVAAEEREGVVHYSLTERP
jgi:glyoxylase-like metal-dependent hydrolase (beta-lactamase superfamily II)